MKAKPLKLIECGYQPCDPKDATHLQLHLPGPLPNRIVPVILSGSRRGTPCWSWNGSVDRPTIKPSVLTKGGDVDGEHVCHSFINDGMVEFLSDCSHGLAGKTLALLDIE